MVLFDKQGMYELIENVSSQVKEGYELGKDIHVANINKIIIAAVGGSSIPGEILKQYLKNTRIPVFLFEEYSLPAFADKNTLVFAISYSGDAEETISMYKDAVKKGCQMISLSAGGKLKDLSLHNRSRHINLPQGKIPRMMYAYMFFSMLKTLENSGIIESQKDYVKRTIKVLESNKFEDITEAIAEKLKNKTPIIYTSPDYEAVARKWKLNFNENTEIPSFYNIFPSASHNELAGFTKLNEDYYVIIIKSEDEDSRLKKRMLIAKDVLREIGMNVTELGITGDSYLTKIFSAILIGDWLSYHLAIKRGVDPTPRRIIDELEKRLKT